MAVGNRTLGVVKYALLPRILPRIANLLFSGFQYFAFYMAQIYRGVRLLPAGHPYLNSAEIGNFSIVDVVAAAGRHLVFRKENIDQIIIYFVLLLGLILMALEAIFMTISLFAPQAMALSLNYYFGTSITSTVSGFDSTQDLAFILLDRVFGIKGIFDSCVSMPVPCLRSAGNGTFEAGSTVFKPGVFPWPYHLALQQLFNFYSVGLLIVGMMIMLYLVIVIVAETAQTGVPFGKRFNKLWAPMRLVVALGLLIPISSGLNSAQFITLYTAKWGSNFATNGWVLFNSSLNALGPTNGSEIVSKPQTPDVRGILEFMMLAHACKAVEEGLIEPPENSKWTPDPNCPIGSDDEENTYVDAYLVKSTGDVTTDNIPLALGDYTAAAVFTDRGPITISFGDRGCTARHNAYAGHIIPICGQLTMNNSSIPNIASGSPNNGAQTIQEGYYNLIQYLWGDYKNNGNVTSGVPLKWAKESYCSNSTEYSSMLSSHASPTSDPELWKRSLYFVQKTCPDPLPTSLMAEPKVDWMTQTAAAYRMGAKTTSYPAAVALSGPSPSVATATVEQIIRDGVKVERNNYAGGSYAIPMDLVSRGWGGAGMWYNQIAQVNGVLSAAAWELPHVSLYPKIMNDTMAAKMRNMPNVSQTDALSGSKSQDSSLQTDRPADSKALKALSPIYYNWMLVQDTEKKGTGNALVDFINFAFGTQGLFDMRDPANQNVHPLALLTALGKGLVETSIRNIIIGMGGQLGQILSTAGGFPAGDAVMKAISGIAYQAAGMTLAAGITLYYILPFMPFIYFFFALGNWIKGVFEAMVGVPLWALAHIRIDGEGLAGPGAINGYYMLFEIFLRPILIVFGLVASVGIFTAMASTFNAIFPLAVNNVGGINYDGATDSTWLETVRGPIDQLFYTVLYAVVMYMMALASFKLIDLIPASIMRWMGQNAVGFGTGGDEAGAFKDKMGGASNQMAQNAISGIRGVGDAGTGIAKAAKG